MRFGVLGPLAVWTADRAAVPIPGTKVRTLLAALLAREGRPVSADRLIDDIWGDDPPGNPAAALAVKVSQLRRALDDAEPGTRALVESGPAGYLLRTRAVDAVEFDQLLTRAGDDSVPAGRAALLDDALALWRGDAYAGFRDAEFARADLVRLDERRLAALDDRAEAHLALGRHTSVAGELADLVARQPLRERTRALRMLALYRSGRQAEALDSYADLRRQLADQLGLDPSPELAALHQAILAQDPSLDRHEATARPPTSNLPAALGDLFGRDDALAELTALVGKHRLLSLTGTGGVGKTRLAVEVAHAARPTFPDGAWLVELAGVEGGPDAVADTIMGTLGLRDAAADPLGVALRARRMLLVLDNCEHLVEAAAVLTARLLRVAPDLKVLTTSREPLGLVGEAVWPVPPLALPDAVQLFTARATAAARGFEADAEQVALLCRRLDGIPLALELAATRVRGLGLDRLVAGLDDRFRLLAAGQRGAPPRQQTLLATIDWSWRLLTAPERIALRRLAVHADGCTLDAAEAVCAAGDVVRADIPELLARLVDRSLVVRSERGDGQPRYRLLESVAAFCLDKMRDAGDLAATRQRHRGYYTALAERAETRLRGPDQAHWLKVLDAESANLRAALDPTHDPALAIRLVEALAWYWFLRGRLGEARRSLQAALDAKASARAAAWLTGFAFLLGDVADWPARHAAAIDALDEPARAEWFLAYAEIDLGDVAATEKLVASILAVFTAEDDHWGTAAALTISAKLAHIRGDTTALGRDGERSAAIFRELGDRWGLLQATEWLAAHAALTGDHEAAERLHTEGLEVARELSLWGDVSGRLGWLGWIAMERGDYATARERCTEALALAEEQGAPLLAVFATMGLAFAARRAGDLDAAATHLGWLLDTAARSDAETGQPLYVPSVLVELGHVATERGDLTTATRHHLDALAAARTLGATRDVALALAGLAATTAADGRFTEAAHLLGAAAATREPTGTPPGPAERADLDRTETAARAALGPAFDTAYLAGAASAP